MIPTSPNEIADERLQLAYDHSLQGERLVKIKKMKAEMWPKLRVNCKSDTQADRAWDATPEGLEEMELRMSMKSKELRMSALKTKIDVLNSEARNQY